MLNHVVRFARRHRRLVAATLLVVLAVGGIVQLERWESGGEGPEQIVTTLTDQCREDPARVPPPPAGASNYLHTCGARIYDAHGRLVQITGVSWFGFETSTMTPDGLWVRNWQTILDQLSALGYNTIRLPFSNDILRPGAKPSGINYLVNPDLQGLTSLQILDKIVEGARQRGLRILLDRHRPTSAGQSELWYTPQVPESTWIRDWTFLAQRYRDDDTVIGADLHNEPRGPATWGTDDPATDWHLAAQRAGNAILAANPYWLIFVEGIEHQGQDWYWWGGNLAGVQRAPVTLSVTNRVVYSPHDYGPEVYPQGWFKDPTFPNNLPSVWDAHWGYIAERNLAPVVLGEFGGRSVGTDAGGQWHRALVAYLRDRHLGFVSWALNPDSGDTGGILEDDWLTVQSQKHDLYSGGLAPQIQPSQPGRTGGAPSLRLTYHTAATGGPNASFVVTLFNDRGADVLLSELTVRYWIGQPPRDAEAVVDWAALGEGHVRARVIAAPCGGQTGYVELSFDAGAGVLKGYSTTGPILVRYHLADWSPLDPTRDRSFRASTSDAPNRRLQVYRNGRLLWGDALSC